MTKLRYLHITITEREAEALLNIPDVPKTIKSEIISKHKGSISLSSKKDYFLKNKFNK